MDFYILIIPRDTQYIVFGALLYAFLRLSLVSCIHCYRRKNKNKKTLEIPAKNFLTTDHVAYFVTKDIYKKSKPDECLL